MASTNENFNASHPAPWRHRWSLLTVVATLALIFIGGLVTSKGAGLSVPDWPLSYGMLMPPMVGNVFYEHGHRMAATFVGLLTLVLAVWTARSESRPGVRRLAWGALAAVVAQGVLGGITVIYLLPAPVSVTHACLAQTFFCIVIALAYVTSTEWSRAREPREDSAGVRGAAIAATIVVFLQLLLGATMRHTGSGLAIPDFPLALGRIVPPFESAGVAVHFAHRIGALTVLAAIVVLLRCCRRLGEPRLSNLAALLSVLVVGQIALGAATVLTGKAPIITTAHVALGAAILGLTWLTALRARRLLTAESSPQATPAEGAVATAWIP